MFAFSAAFLFLLQFYLRFFFRQRRWPNVGTLSHKECLKIKLQQNTWKTGNILVDRRFVDAIVFANDCDCERFDLCLFIFALAFSPFPEHQIHTISYVLRFDI